MMTTRLDPQQLDAAWDALQRGGSAAPLPGDSIDRSVFETLHELFHPVPSERFVRGLEEILMSSSAAAPAQIASTPQSIARTPLPVAARIVVMSRWMRAAASLAAIALLVAISAVVLSNRFGSPDSTVIPAVSDQVGQGPATSSDAVFTTWFEQRFPIDALSSYGVDQWHWVEMVQGMVNPGEQSRTPRAEVSAPGNALHYLLAMDGELAVTLDSSGIMFSTLHPNAGTEVGPGTVVLQSGDTLLYHAAEAIWNPSDTRTGFILGTLASASSRFDPPTGAVRMSVGNGAIPPDFAADATSLEMSLQRVDIQPGETFGYAISPKTILMANAKGGLLERQAWAEGEPVGKPVKIIANEPYLLHNYGSGYFTLTNISANPVSIVLFSVAPPGSEYSANPAGTAVVDTPFGTWIPDPTPIPNSSEIQQGRHE